jgi:hypothetical protein
MTTNKAERNDVDISKLFSWGNKFTIEGKGDVKVEAYIRLLGDADLNRARVFALRKSAELRRKLKTPDSEERMARIPEVDLVEKDALVENLVTYYIREATMKAYNEVDVPEPKPLDSDATLEEQEKFQEEVDSYPDRLNEAIRDFITKEIDKERKKLNKRTKEELAEEYEQTLINRHCENEMVKRMKEMCVFLGTYYDPDYKTRLFSSFEQFDNLPVEIKKQFIEHYSSLEISTDELKN